MLQLAFAVHGLTALYTSEVCLGHDPGNKGTLPSGLPNAHPESVERLSRLLHSLHNDWAPAFGDALHVVDKRDVDVTRDQLLRVHTPAYLERCERLFSQAQQPVGERYIRVNFDASTVVSRGSQAAAARAAGLVVSAVDDVLSTSGSSGELHRAFVMVRPPGHHAEAGKSGGFCVYNNVLVGVAHAQAVHGVGNVAILDFDVHHGNGDSELSWCDPTRLYASSHEAELWPGTGATWGCDGLHGQIVNCPLPPGAGSAAFRTAWTETLLPAVRRFDPDVVFLSAGFDAHADDPLASMTLQPADFAWLTREVAALDVPIISVLEGGYNVNALEASVYAHLRALIES